MGAVQVAPRAMRESDAKTTTGLEPAPYGRCMTTSDPDLLDFTPSFAHVGLETWDALRRIGTDRNAMERLHVTMLKTGRFAQAMAAPALLNELRYDEELAALAGKADLTHLSGLLVALLNASFESHVAAMLG